MMCLAGSTDIVASIVHYSAVTRCPACNDSFSHVRSTTGHRRSAGHSGGCAVETQRTWAGNRTRSRDTGHCRLWRDHTRRCLPVQRWVGRSRTRRQRPGHSTWRRYFTHHSGLVLSSQSPPRNELSWEA